MPPHFDPLTDMSALRIGLVGPLPPPAGGMANQTRQLARLLGEDGVQVEVVQVNAPYRPGWIGSIQGVRAIFRLLPYLAKLWRSAGRVSLFHVMANSGWSWHLFAAPAVWIGWLRGIPVVVNYRGGEAETFFAHAFRRVRPTLRRAAAVVVPSDFLAGVFNTRQIATITVPNIIDIQRFASENQNRHESLNVLVTRNLEPIYDISTALRTFHRVVSECPGATLTVCGSGPDREQLEAQCRQLGIADAVSFTGTVDNDRMADLYHAAGVLLNTSLVDNMPISILEALACGVPVVSTDAGGIPFLVEHNKSALLFAPGDDAGMAAAIVSLFTDRARADELSRAGLEEVQQYAWPAVKLKLLALYQSVLSQQDGGRRQRHAA